LTSLQQRLMKTGGRLVKHARYYWLLFAEGRLTRQLVGAIVRRLGMLPGRAGQQPAIVAANDGGEEVEGDGSEKSFASATMPGAGGSDGVRTGFHGAIGHTRPRRARWASSYRRCSDTNNGNAGYVSVPRDLGACVPCCIRADGRSCETPPDEKSDPLSRNPLPFASVLLLEPTDESSPGVDTGSVPPLRHTVGLRSTSKGGVLTRPRVRVPEAAQP